MKEELYIYTKDGVRKSVDLNTPSGITLKWVSNLFNSLDKVNCSYSYTFKIPITRHNREIFDMAEDIRHDSTMLGRKVKAEFIQNGIPLFDNANLYISKSTADSYSCVFTWGVLEGLQKLKDESCSLNELRTALIKAGEDDDELTDEGVAQWYNVYNLINGMNDKVKVWNNDAKILYPYYGNYVSDPSYSEYPDFKNTYKGGIPKPVMPVRYLLNCIYKAFGVKISLGEHKEVRDNLPTTPAVKWLYNDFNIINYGVLPLTGNELTDKQQEKYKTTLDFETEIGGDYKILGTMEILYFGKIKLPSYSSVFYPTIDFIRPEAYRYKDENGKNISWGIEDRAKYEAKNLSDWNNPNFACTGISVWKECQVKMQFKAEHIISNKANDYLEEEHFIPLKVFSWKISNEGWSNEKIEIVEVASINPTSVEKRGDEYYEIFNYMEDEGYKAFTFKNDEVSDKYQYAEYWFGSDTFHLYPFVKTGDFIFEPLISDADYQPHIIDTYTNLPDIDCLTFVKSLFYMVGGFPTIKNDNTIGATLYKVIKENLSKGNVYDWSNKVMNGSFIPEEISYKSSDFKQNNYYMNKWDDLDRTQEELKDEDDVYEDGIGDIVCQDETLDKEQTVQQIPFYPPYILNRKYPSTTDKTIKFVDYDISSDDYKLNNGRYENTNKVKYVESKAAYGYIHRIPFFDKMKSGRIKSWEENYGVSQYNRMSVLNPFKDILMNPSYRYFQQIIEKPYTITENLLLDELDLMSIDYAKPVYIEKYNSYFAIISIQRDSKGVCKCELIKLPAYKAPAKVTLSFTSQLAKFLHFKCSSTSSEDKKIMIGFIIENANEGQYVLHSQINLSGGEFQLFNPTSNTNWVIKDIWLDHYEKGDYNDYEFEIQ